MDTNVVSMWLNVVSQFIQPCKNRIMWQTGDGSVKRVFAVQM